MRLAQGRLKAFNHSFFCLHEAGTSQFTTEASARLFYFLLVSYSLSTFVSLEHLNFSLFLSLSLSLSLNPGPPDHSPGQCSERRGVYSLSLSLSISLSLFLSLSLSLSLNPGPPDHSPGQCSERRGVYSLSLSLSLSLCLLLQSWKFLLLYIFEIHERRRLVKG